MRIDEWVRNVNRDTPVPIYFQLQQLIKSDIDQGRLKPGELIPTEAELCQALQLSRPTIRQCMNVLVSEGYINRRKGKGTFVSMPKLEANFIQKLESFNAEMLNRGMVPHTRVMELRIVPGELEVCGKLGLDASEHLVYLERLCFADSAPMAYLKSYLPAARFPGLLDEDFTQHSLYTVLQKRYGVEVEHVHRQIEAVDISTHEAELLGLSRGKAACLVQNTAYDQNSTPVEFAVALYRGDRNKFTMDMYR